MDLVVMEESRTEGVLQLVYEMCKKLPRERERAKKKT